MSLASDDAFGVPAFDLEPIESGTSILLTGDDTEALKTVFTELVAAPDEERSVVLATETGGRRVQRDLNTARTGAGQRTFVLTCEGPSAGDDVTSIDDLGDLTALGMEFSSLVAASQQQSSRFRSGVFLCSTIATEVEDLRSLYRFLNANFLTALRRGDGIGVCAIDTSADIGADTQSTLAGLQTSFTATIEVERTGPQSATLSIDGITGAPETLDVSL